jgi:hypothetical protein
MICDIIVDKAKTIGVSDLVKYHKDAKANGWSNIINRIVRTQNKIYFASRAKLEACKLLSHLDEPAVDMPSQIFKDIVEGRIGIERTRLEEFLDEDSMAKIMDENCREACETLSDLVDKLFDPESAPVPMPARVKVRRVSESEKRMKASFDAAWKACRKKSKTKKSFDAVWGLKNGTH